MRVRFADTSFWFGLHIASDRRHEPAVELWREGGRIVTTDLVLGETWTLLRVRGTSHDRVVELIDAVRASPRIEVVHVDAGVVEEAWAWLRTRGERVYSFVDATSFVVMRRRRLVEALCFDGDFAAAGFVEVRP
ncbi:MAG: 23S rRNA-specific endonuclease VapC20 [Acidimicrobiia bacterium]|jgi:predicted nucleic acid-binding protein|nr:MAG: 23S rRNA-specific endonuclease VapC20 [Acidimicrobiia bacterium]